MTKRRRILFTLFEGAQPTTSLERASAWAGLLDCELHVVQIVARCAPRSSGVLQSTLLEALRAAEPAIRLERIATGWLANALGLEREADSACVQIGDFVKQAAARAAEADADLIVMGARQGRLGGRATALAGAARLPVLVARGATPEQSIVAATDLEDVRYRVLQAAAQLGRRLDAPVIALHNLEPVSDFSAIDRASSSATSFGQTLADLKRRHLEQVVQDLPGRATPVLANQTDPANGILQEARVRRVGLIVVGARPRGERNSVPVRVIEGAHCSVLVVPLDDGGPARPPLAWT